MSLVGELKDHDRAIMERVKSESWMAQWDDGNSTFFGPRKLHYMTEAELRERKKELKRKLEDAKARAIAKSRT